jgi:Plasmid pRiA4b ORF-3-like protein
MKTCILEVHLLRHREVSRTIEIPEAFSLYRLAEAVIGAFGFGFDHAFGFFDFDQGTGNIFAAEKKYDLFTDMIEEGQDIEPTGAGSVKKTMVAEVWRKPGDRMVMLFDYGDDWRFNVVLKAWGLQDKKRKYPAILEKTGRAPKQYA